MAKFIHCDCISYLQHELLRILYPVFVHCFMDLVAKGHLQEGTLFIVILFLLCILAANVLEEHTSLLLLLAFLANNMLFSSARAFFNKFREDHEMMHLRDLQKLEGVLSPSHLEVTCLLRYANYYFCTIVDDFCSIFSYYNAGDGICSFSEAE